MKFSFYCVQCGKDKEIEIDSRSADPNTTIKQLIERCGWIAQMNYPYMDVYCSKRCAL